jgi:hypothetical protein
MKLPQDQSAIGHLTLDDVVLMEDAPANLLSQGTLLAKGWDVDITQHGGMISKHGINIPVYKTLRAFRLPLKKDFCKDATVITHLRPQITYCNSCHTIATGSHNLRLAVTIYV